MASPLERYRPLLLVLLLVALLAIGKLSGFTDDLDGAAIRAKVLEAGSFGILIFFVLFIVGELLHVPGLVFIVAGVGIYGPRLGFVIGFVGAIVSVCASFVMVRTVGGQALTKIERPWFKKILARLDARPVTTVVVLRSILWVAPPLNYALAMTGIRFRDYLIGSSIGLVLPVLGITFFSGLLLS